MNKVTIIGRLVDAPEERSTPSGTNVTRFRIAVNRRFNREQTDFIPIVAWRQLGDLCTKYLVKGQQVAVSGELHIESYEDSNGNRRTRAEVVADDVEFLAKPAGSSDRGGFTQQSENKAADQDADLFAKDMGGMLMDDEQLPF